MARISILTNLFARLATWFYNGPISLQDEPGDTFHLCSTLCHKVIHKTVLAHPGAFFLVISILCGYLPWLVAPWGLGKIIITVILNLLLIEINGGFKNGDGVSGRLVEYAAMIFLCSVCLSALFSRDPHMSWLGVYSAHRSSVLDMMLYCLLWGCVGARDRGAVWFGVLVGGLLNVTVAYGQMIFGVEHLPMLMSGRLTGLTGSPLSLAVVFGLVGVAWLEAGLPRYALLALVPVLWGTASRAGIAGAFVSWGLWHALRGGRSGKVVLGIVLGICAVLAVHRVRSTSLSDTGRGLIWRAAWAGFKSSPIVGQGPATTLLVFDEHRDDAWQAVFRDQSQEHAHNIFLEALCSVGMVGFTAFCLLLLAVALGVRNDHGTICALLAFVPTALVDPLLIPLPAVFVILATCAFPKGRASRPWLSRIACVGVLAGYSWFYVRDRRMKIFGGDTGDVAAMQSAIELGLIYTKSLRDTR